MKRDLNKTKGLLEEFSKAKGQVERRVKNNNPKQPIDRRGYSEVRKRNSGSSQYAQYVRKFEAGDLSKFSSQDMMYFFKDTAEKAGVKYILAKPQVIMRTFNLAKERGYSNEDILLMVEFLFNSDQTYLNKRDLHPGILLTGWCNKIYQDAQLWLKDAYFDKKVTKRRTREWEKPVEVEDNATIGEWDM